MELDINKFVKKFGYDKQEQLIEHKHKFAPKSHCVLTGATGSGKTKLLCDMILNMFNFNEIYILSTDLEEKYYLTLKRVFEDIGKELDSDIIYLCDTLEDFPKVEELEHEEETQRILIFDDVIHLPKKELRKINEYYIRSRKRCCQCFFLTQSYFEVPKTIRGNSKTNIIFLRDIVNEYDKREIKKALFPDLNNKQFRNLIGYMKDYDHILIDNATKDNEKYKYRLNTVLPVDVNKL